MRTVLPFEGTTFLSINYFKEMRVTRFYFFNQQVFEEYMEFQKEFGWEVSYVPTDAFFFGLKIGQKISVSLPNENGETTVSSLSDFRFILSSLCE
jgi:pyruvate carboxylase